jgi:hypothetical protein
LIIQLDKYTLFSTFGVEEFEAIENNINTMAPSMVEYYLSDLISSSDNAPGYINKSYVQKSINLNEYHLHLDYNEDTFLEIKQNSNTYETESLW